MKAHPHTIHDIVWNALGGAIVIFVFISLWRARGTSEAHSSFQGAACRQALVEYARAIALYRSEYGTFPPSMEALWVYGDDPPPHCPCVDFATQGTGYCYRMPRIPGKVEPIMWDRKPRRRRLPGRNESEDTLVLNVLLEDGRVVRVSSATELAWKAAHPSIGLKPKPIAEHHK